MMLRNLQGKELCKRETLVLPLALPSLLLFQASLCPRGLKNAVALAFFNLILFIFGLHVSEEVPVKLSAKRSGPEKYDLIIFT